MRSGTLLAVISIQGAVATHSTPGAPMGRTQAAIRLGTGEHAVDLWFDGCAIGAGRHEGSYNAKNLLVSGGRVPFSSSLTIASAELHLEQFPCRGDSSPPVTTATLSPEPNPDGWNSGTVVVRLEASDESGGSGVDRIEHEMSGAQSGHVATRCHIRRF